MSAVVRRHEIRKRQKRQQQLRKFRAKLAKATSKTQQEAVMNKLRKIAPWVPDREWLNGATKAQAAANTKTTRRAA